VIIGHDKENIRATRWLRRKTTTATENHQANRAIFFNHLDFFIISGWRDGTGKS
jgi:hypothetical protein